MRISWRGDRDLERELRAQRPEPSRELVDSVVRMVDAGRGRHSARSVRLGLAVALSAGALVALAATGGLSYAASGVTRAAESAVHVVAPTKHVSPSGALGSAQAQYLVAVCFHGRTIRVDSHAESVLLRVGASRGACSGGTFTPPANAARMCFKGHNVIVAASDVARLRKLGFTKGFCGSSCRGETR